jgi:transcriptional regulator with XRE-family HTH domain
MTLPEAIRLLRKKVGLSQADLAKRIDTTTFTISRWETGRREPNSAAMRKLAKVAEDGGFLAMRDFLEFHRKSAIAERMVNLQSPGTQRRVSADELELLSNLLGEIRDFAHRPDTVSELATKAINVIDPYLLKKKRTHGKTK